MICLNIINEHVGVAGVLSVSYEHVSVAWQVCCL